MRFDTFVIFKIVICSRPSVYYTTVSFWLWPPFPCLSDITAREDLNRVKTWIKSSYTRRVVQADERDGPKPSQRAADSLTAVSIFILNCKHINISWQLVNFAESTTICRHVVSGSLVFFPDSDPWTRAYADTLASLSIPMTRTSLNDIATPCVMCVYLSEIFKQPTRKLPILAFCRSASIQIKLDGANLNYPLKSLLVHKWHSSI